MSASIWQTIVTVCGVLGTIAFVCSTIWIVSYAAMIWRRYRPRNKAKIILDPHLPCPHGFHNHDICPDCFH